MEDLVAGVVYQELKLEVERASNFLARAQFKLLQISLGQTEPLSFDHRACSKPKVTRRAKTESTKKQYFGSIFYVQNLRKKLSRTYGFQARTWPKLLALVLRGKLRLGPSSPSNGSFNL